MYELAKKLLEPYAVCLIASVFASGYLWRKQPARRRGHALLFAMLLGLLALSTPVASYFALGSLEWSCLPLDKCPETAQAIVVLGGSLQPPDHVHPRADLDVDTFYRCHEALRLYRVSKPCLVVLSGGKADADRSGPTLAAAMQEFLVFHGVPAKEIVLEDQSTTTFENAVESRKLLDARAIHEIVLVTDAASMRRAQRCFERQGLLVHPAGCRYRARELPLSPSTVWPQPAAAAGCDEACYEWIGLLWYWLRGRI